MYHPTRENLSLALASFTMASMITIAACGGSSPEATHDASQPLRDAGAGGEDASQQGQNGDASAAPDAALPDIRGLYVVDEGSRSLVRVPLIDPRAPSVVVSTEGSRGEGPGFEVPIDVVVDARSALAYVLDNGLSSVVRVDLVNGDRSLVDSTSPTGEKLWSEARALTLNADASEVLVLGDGEIIRIDVDGSEAPTATALPEEIDAVDLEVLSESRVALLDTRRSSVVATTDDSVIDVLSGDNSDRETVGSGPPLNAGVSLAVESTSAAYALTGIGMLKIDLVSGDRQLVSGRDDDGQMRGLGIPFGIPTALAIDADGKAYIVDRIVNGGSVLGISLTTGDRSSVIVRDEEDQDLLATPSGIDVAN